ELADKLVRQVHDLRDKRVARRKHPAEATVWVKGRTLRAREASRDMKASIDELADKLVRQVHDLRDKRVARRKHPAEATEITES
ncbi:MAG: HPF/RaiA family ribosome-associated protein, partial [Actinobacteria bacterium]|nr:HPF/RaiA family ribosome-associated protein [Actinomycetota bacterium]